MLSSERGGKVSVWDRRCARKRKAVGKGNTLIIIVSRGATDISGNGARCAPQPDRRRRRRRALVIKAIDQVLANHLPLPESTSYSRNYTMFAADAPIHR